MGRATSAMRGLPLAEPWLQPSRSREGVIRKSFREIGAATADWHRTRAYPPTRRTWITVQDRAVLHVRSVADYDRFIVAANHDRKPNTRLSAQDDVADDLGRGREPD